MDILFFFKSMFWPTYWLLKPANFERWWNTESSVNFEPVLLDQWYDWWGKWGINTTQECTCNKLTLEYTWLEWLLWHRIQAWVVPLLINLYSIDNFVDRLLHTETHPSSQSIRATEIHKIQCNPLNLVACLLSKKHPLNVTKVDSSRHWIQCWTLNSVSNVNSR